jgi:hypothetical protein
MSQPTAVGASSAQAMAVDPHDDPNRLTTSQLEQTVAGPQPEPEIVVQAPPRQTQKNAKTSRQIQIEQSMEMIRSATAP